MRFAFFTLLLALPVFAHQSSINSKGNKLKWPETNVSILIRTNTSDLPSSTTRSLIQTSISEWNSASRINLTSSSISNNEIKFQSDFSKYGSAVVGVTEVSSTSGGKITKGIIRLNDNYTFKSTPGNYSFGEVFLGDVVTHEIGHFFGLSHSEILNSSMFYSAFSGQSTIGYDDKSGIRTKYDSGFGRIYGNVRGGSNIGVLGAQVQLVSLKTGDTIGAITDENGYFDVRGLDLNDTFYLYTSPIKNQDSLPGIFSNVQTEFCPASYVGSFFNACGSDAQGFPQGITLTSNRTSVNVGTVTINCELKTSTDYSYEKIQPTFDPLLVYDYSRDARVEKSFTGYFLAPSDTDWSEPDLLQIDLRGFGNLSGSQKFLKVRLVSQPFGNQLEYQMDLSQNGDPLDDYSREISYSTVFQTYSTDMEVLLPLSPTASENIFEVSLRARKMSNFFIAQTFPSPEIFSSGQHLPYLLMMSLWRDQNGSVTPFLSTESELSDNDACLDAPFTYQVKSADLREEPGNGSGAAAASAGCGTLSSSDDDNGPSSGLMIGFTLAMFLMTIAKRTKKFLS